MIGGIVPITVNTDKGTEKPRYFTKGINTFI
jgi:hypothetical protein